MRRFCWITGLGVGLGLAGSVSCFGADLWISNHSRIAERRVVHEIIGRTNYVYDAKGVEEFVRGEAIAFHVKDSENVTIRNVELDWVRPSMTESRVIAFESGTTIVRIDRKRFPITFLDGRMWMVGPGWTNGVFRVKLYDGKTGEHIPETGDIRFYGEAYELPDGSVALNRDFSHEGSGLRPGDAIVFRPELRPYPAIFIENSKDVKLLDVIVHDAYGMALVAQRSENVSWCGSRSASSKTSGVWPRRGCFASSHADATHFSNVKGMVSVENCWFEGMMDDAINVHSTCLQITNVIGNTIRCMYRHEESVGFDVFDVGERIRFIRSRTNEYGPEMTVVAQSRLASDEVELTLSGCVPTGYGVGDTVENADYQCAAVFRNNIVRNNRARGSLFTTPKPVRVESNRFERCTGAGVVLASDAFYWFESGHCTDVLIRGNVFSNCLASASRHGSSFGVISIDPPVVELAQQTDYVHRNLRIIDNEIFTFDATLLFARSTQDILWQNNIVRYNNDFKGWGKPPFVFERSSGFNAVPAAAGDVPEYEVWIRSSADKTLQPFRFYVPVAAKGRRAPLLVALHTWSYDQRSEWPWGWAKDECEKRGWVLVYPKFRGPNWLPEACCSDLAVQDILDAVEYAKRNADIDTNRIYLTGGSGGGQMSLMMAGRHPEVWAGVYSACPITDIARWHADCIRLKRGYAEHLEKACGGTPDANPGEYRRRSPITWLAAARKAGTPIQIATGIHDGHWPGSVPIGHSIRAFNALAASDAAYTEDEIAYMESKERVPDGLQFKGADPFFDEKSCIYVRRTSRNVRLTIFEGGHSGNFDAGIDWLARQVRGKPVDWTLPPSGVGHASQVTK